MPRYLVFSPLSHEISNAYAYPKYDKIPSALEINKLIYLEPIFKHLEQDTEEYP